MNRISRLYVAAVLAVLPQQAIAQAQFAGNWQIDIRTIDYPAKPVTYSFRDGMYECKTCATKIHVKADGKDQKIEGNPYADTLAVKIIDKNNLEMTAKKGGKVVSKHKAVVSVDTNSMMLDYAETAPNGETVKGAISYARTTYDKTAPHLMSGSWKAIKAEKRSDNGLKLAYKVEGKSLSYSAPTGESYKAEIGGPDAPFAGDPGINAVSVKLVKNTLEETFKLDGKTVVTRSTNIKPDGKSAKVDWIDYRTRTNGNHVIVKH
ncbi:MAG TPA: hypothetical protein VFV17_01370 [Usitatibacteraceae bacterium]|nr:hypothetical protein [Usitatibacteraceae bacterium]